MKRIFNIIKVKRISLYFEHRSQTGSTQGESDLQSHLFVPVYLGYWLPVSVSVGPWNMLHPCMNKH